MSFRGHPDARHPQSSSLIIRIIRVIRGYPGARHRTEYRCAEYEYHYVEYEYDQYLSFSCHSCISWSHPARAITHQTSVSPRLCETPRRAPTPLRT